MQILFTKMHGLGNDFIIIDGVNQSLSLTTEQIVFLCHRRFGIGCDQLFLVRQSNQKNVDFSCSIFNSDGSYAKHCGNGIRCVAKFLQAQHLSDKQTITLEVAGNVIDAVINDDATVSVNMGLPIFSPDKVPFIHQVEKQTYEVSGYTIGVLSMGNPHAVMCVNDVANIDVSGIGGRIQKSALFPDGVNVGFAQILKSDTIKLRVFERGVGETIACGTGACAAMVIGQMQKNLAQTVKVDLPGGRLTIRWNGSEHPVKMTGPAEHVFDGQIII